MNYPQYLNQITNGMSVCTCAVMFENSPVYELIFAGGNSVDYQCVQILFTTALNMYWSEEKLEVWFEKIKHNIKWSHCV